MSEPMQNPGPEQVEQPAPPQQAPPQPAPPQVDASRLSSANDPRRKSPFLACVLSAMPGLGQVYVGYYQRGFVHAIVVAVLISLLSSGIGLPMAPLLGLLLAFFWLYNVVDAGRRAVLYNEVLAGRSGIQLPEEAELAMAGIRGSFAGGMTLIVFGALLLAHTLFGFSLDWIEDWWPAIFIGFGAFLVYRSRQDRQKQELGAYDEG